MATPNTELLDLESLRCFQAALEQSSFRAAAARVHLSPAAFGERIARLEGQLGVQLFRRTTRRLEVTPAGERLRPLVAQALVAERAIWEAPLDGAETPYSLTLGTRYELGLSWLVPRLSDLSAERPERTLHLAFGDTQALMTRLEARNIDALVSSARISTSGLAYAPLHDERYVFVGAPSALERSPLVRADDALAHTLIDARPDLPLFRYFLDVVPPEPSWAFARHEYMGTIAAVRARVLSGYGVSVLPKYFVESDIDRGELLVVGPEVELARDVFRLIWRAEHPREAQLRQLGETLRSYPLV